MALNLKQSLAEGIGVFSRYGWSDGKTETWAFMQIDRLISGGVYVNGRFWKRSVDQIGVAAVRNTFPEISAISWQKVEWASSSVPAGLTTGRSRFWKPMMRGKPSRRGLSLVTTSTSRIRPITKTVALSACFRSGCIGKGYLQYSSPCTLTTNADPAITRLPQHIQNLLPFFGASRH